MFPSILKRNAAHRINICCQFHAFEKIMDVEAAGNSTTLINYKTIDKNPIKGVSFYRLLQVDFDGNQEYSAAVSLYNYNLDSHFNVYPNPVNSSSRISIRLDKGADITFRVFDMTGKMYKEFTQRNAVAGENQFTFDASGLSSGTYVLAATVGSVRTQSRLFSVAK